MKKRLTLALAAGALVVAMLPGVASAGQPTEEKCLKVAAKFGYVGGDFGAVYIGTNGADTSYEPGGVSDFYNVGTADLVCGFNGDDAVQSLGTGDVFIGGNGDDALTTNTVGGTFFGGNGDDSVTYNSSSTFVGGKGDDSVKDNDASTFDGGKGYDQVTYCNYKATNIDVESVASGAC